MSAITESSATPAKILSFIRDLPNLCSLAGLFCAILAIYFAILGIFPAAMIGLIWAIFFDWSDGVLARRIKGRDKNQQHFGAQLDSLIDIVSFAVCPAVVLLSYGDFNPWFIPGAFCIVAAGVLRLSYFNVFGLIDNSTYQGLALDNNAMILVLLVSLDGLVSSSVFASILYIVLVALAVLNVAPIRTPKLSGGWYYALTAYTFTMTFVFGWQLLDIFR